MDFFGPKRTDLRRTQEIKTQVIETLGLGEDGTVRVTELACEDEDCSDLETIIAVLQTGREKLQVKLNAGIAELSNEQIRDACYSLSVIQRARFGVARMK